MAVNISSRYPISNPWLIDDPPKYLAYEFENSVDFNDARIWAKEKLPSVYASCFLYFIFVHIGPTLMKNRKPFDLQKSLALWNFLLAIFSIMGAIRTIPTYLSSVQQPGGIYNRFCIRSGLSQPFAFWGVAFTVSKFFEFGDTVFIVLRKKPVIFLHWFHHLTIFCCSFIALIEAEPVGGFAVILNYSVHSIMYTYFTLMALRIKIPRRVAMLITSLQILQFVAALGMNVYTVAIRANGGECARSPISIQMQLSVGGIYLALFMRLFYQSYIAKEKLKRS